MCVFTHTDPCSFFVTTNVSKKVLIIVTVREACAALIDLTIINRHTRRIMEMAFYWGEMRT